MALFEDRKIKRALKAIQRQQQHNAINPGDICPRCGDMTMGSSSVYLPDEGVYVCAECNMEMSLASFTGGEDYSKWVAIAGIADDEEWKPKKRMRREAISKFEVGDHIIDSVSEFPGVVREVLPHGLYSVQPDGEPENSLLTLKDREMVFDIDQTLKSAASRFHEGDLLMVYRAFGVVDSMTNPRDAAVIACDDAGHLTVKLDNDETSILCIDIDLFQLYREVEPVSIKREATLDFSNEVEIIF